MRECEREREKKDVTGYLIAVSEILRARIYIRCFLLILLFFFFMSDDFLFNFHVEAPRL